MGAVCDGKKVQPRLLPQPFIRLTEVQLPFFFFVCFFTLCSVLDVLFDLSADELVLCGFRAGSETLQHVASLIDAHGKLETPATGVL